MNKELTPLEVSKQLKDFVLEFIKNGLDRRFIHGSFDIIETALKKQEQNQKKVKAFEIIKKKRVDIQLLKDSKNLNDYNWCVHTKDRAITQEEFDLLKEVLLCRQ